MGAVVKLPAWIPAPPAQPALHLMKVTVTTDTQRRFEYERAFASSFAAYDWALDRHPSVARIEVKKVEGQRHA